jgi:hypothetical protein
MFCEAHRSNAAALLPTESVEHMKSLLIAEDKKDSSDIDSKFSFPLREPDYPLIG